MIPHCDWHVCKRVRANTTVYGTYLITLWHPNAAAVPATTNGKLLENLLNFIAECTMDVPKMGRTNKESHSPHFWEVGYYLENVKFSAAMINSKPPFYKKTAPPIISKGYVSKQKHCYKSACMLLCQFRRLHCAKLPRFFYCDVALDCTHWPMWMS